MSVVIKGIKQGVLANLDDQQDWDNLISEVQTTIDERAAFFKGARWVVDLGSRKVEVDEINQLIGILETREVGLLALLTTQDDTRAAAELLEIITKLEDIPEPPRRERPSSTSLPISEFASEMEDEEEALPPMDSEEYGTTGVLINRTLRNGRTVRSSGHVVVIGDVNAGAEIIAVGDIVVWGNLRGIVHAGAEGNEEAIVCALNLAPTQLRIGSLITIPPQDKRRNPRPEMARVNNGQIEAIPWV